MDTPDLVDLALAVVHAVPEPVALRLAAAIERQDDLTSASARRRVAAEVAQASQRATVARLLEGWAAHHLGVPPIAVAYALRTAVRAVAMQRAEGGVELVWTGPNPEGTPLRRTDQALLEVIEAAQHTLTVVTFAAYSVPAIAAALVRAAQRGVRIRIIIESAQVSEGKIAYEAMDALGAHVSAMAAVYVWPLAHRPLDDKGRHGSLHAKCAVADDAVLFISSANLTAYALSLNMELGVLVHGGAVPGRVAHHFTRLIEHGVIQGVGRGGRPVTHVLRPSRKGQARDRE